MIRLLAEFSVGFTLVIKRKSFIAGFSVICNLILALRIAVVWDLIPCSLVYSYWCFRGTFCLHLKLEEPQMSHKLISVKHLWGYMIPCVVKHMKERFCVFSLQYGKLDSCHVVQMEYSNSVRDILNHYTSAYINKMLTIIRRHS
jgi:hypothetical protein